MMTPELKWGLSIGVAYLAWLYGSYYLGLHTGGIGLMQVAFLSGYAIEIAGLFLALRGKVRREPETGLGEGIKSGAIIAGISGIVAGLAWFGYFQAINPGLTDYMVEQTRAHYEGQGLATEELEEILNVFRDSFSRRAYIIQGAVGLFIVGSLASAVLMAAFRFRNR